MQSQLKHHEPLYLKYRPQSLAELIGQEAVTRTLTNAINHNRLSHAYLFTGPRGTGKTSSARILAKSLNCLAAGKPTVTPCQTCACCESITQGNSPAVFEIDAASNNSVDDARVLIERAPLVAVGGEFKVYIIDECHMLSKEAFNALLKTIEQPPPKVVFILATTEEHKVLPTIVSRCQRLLFRLISQEPLIEHLRDVAQRENIEIENDALRLIARRSAGGLRDALGSLDQASLLAAPGKPATIADLLALFGALHEDILLDISRQILERDGQQVINSVNQILAEGREPAVVVQELSRHFLNILKACYMGGDEAVGELVVGSQQYINALLEIAPQFERSELSQIVEALERLEQTCRRTTQPAMHLEIGLLSICHRHDMLLVRELSERVAKLEAAVESGQTIGSSGPLPRVSLPPVTQKRAVAPLKPAVVQPEERPPVKQADTEIQQTVALEIKVLENETFVEKNISETVVVTGEAEPIVTTSTEAPVSTEVPETVPLAPSAPEAQEAGIDIEHLWSQILDELQRRHIPTFSLASTQAFPLELSNRELAVGVLKETFQKMLESKIDYLTAACRAVVGEEINVRIRVTSADTRTSANSAQRQVKASSAPVERKTNVAAASSETESAVIGTEQIGALTVLSDTDDVDSTMVKEAYKLFDGPGSRRIQ